MAVAYQRWLEQTKAALPLGEKMRRGFAQLYRSKGERQQISGYYPADFVIDVETAARGRGNRDRCSRRWRLAESFETSRASSVGLLRNDSMATILDRLVVLGLDGATWTVLDPMRRRGLMPNLDALLAGAAHGTLAVDRSRR